MQKEPKANLLVYSGSTKAKREIIELANKRFGISVKSDKVQFVKLESHVWMDPSHYPSFTMVW